MMSLRMLGDMTGRRVLITGGTGHLGRVMAETVAEQGAAVLLLDRSHLAIRNTSLLINLSVRNRLRSWTRRGPLEFYFSHY